MRRLAFALTLAAACKGSGSDDPAPPGPPVISIAPLRAREGLAAPVHTAFRATLDHASDSEVSVAWTTVDGTATAGEDYVAASGTLVFPPGATEATAAVDVLSDAVHETLESFSLALSTPVGATLAAPSAAVEIQDDDADPRTSYEYQRSALWLSPAALRAGRPGGFVLASCVADFDGDGDDDVLLAPGDGSQNPMPVEFYRNDGGAFVYDASVLPQPTPGLVHARKCLTGDFDGDGRVDAFVTGHGYDQPPWPGEAPLLLLNGASGTFVQGTLPAGVAGYDHGAAAGDADEDGDLDVFVTKTDGPYFLVNDGAGAFTLDTARVPASIRGGAPIFTAELVDVDVDGHLDLLVSGHEQSGGLRATIFWGDGSGTFTDAARTQLPAVAGWGVTIDLDAEDLDGDGLRDVVLDRTQDDTVVSTAFYQGYRLQLARQTSPRVFEDVSDTALAAARSDTGSWFPWIHLLDVDGDGDVDVRVDDASLNLKWLNDGSGRFDAP